MISLPHDYVLPEDILDLVGAFNRFKIMSTYGAEDSKSLLRAEKEFVGSVRHLGRNILEDCDEV